MNKVELLGIAFDDLALSAAVERALSLMDERRAAYVVTPNPEIVLDARKNPALNTAIAGAALTLPDGVGVIYASRILGRELRHRVPGIDFASALMERMGESGRSVYLLGAKPGVAELAGGNLTAQYDGLVLSGWHDGYFSEEENEGVLAAINAASPDLLLVCLGSPKQELWMQRNAPRLKVGLMAGLGGALDVYAGLVERAPRRWSELGLEWLYRLIKEPKRMRRMVRLPGILAAALRERIGGSKLE